MRLAVITVTTRSHLPFFKAFSASLRKYHPDWPLYTLILTRDGMPCEIESRPDYTPLFLNDIASPGEWLDRAFYYKAYEFCCAVRPLLHRYMDVQTDFDGWFYFDNDILVYHSLDELAANLEKTSILLSPHTLEPLTQQNSDLATWHAAIRLDRDAIQSGMFNGGFLGLRRSAAARAFIDWWEDRLRWFCFHNPPDSFLDQFWLSLVPQYFQPVHVLRHPGANVACWNLHERKISKTPEGQILVNNQPLLFFHFSGFEIEHLPEISTYDFLQKIAPQAFTAAKELSLDYKERLMKHGYTAQSQGDYEFGFFKNRETVTPQMRHFYYDLLRAGMVPFQGAPFDQYSFFHAHVRSQLLKSWLRRILRSLYVWLKNHLPLD